MSDEVLKALNICIESCGLLLALVLLAGMSHEEAMAKRKLLLSAMWLHLLVTCGGLLSFSLNGQPGALARAGLTVGTWVSMVCSILTRTAVMAYIFTDGEARAIHDTKVGLLVKLLAITNAFDLVLAMSDPITHAYFVVSADNELMWGSCIPVHQVIEIALIVLVIPVLLGLRAHRHRSTTVRLVFCGALAFAASLIDNMVPGLFAMPIAVALILLLLTVGIQSHMEEDLAKARAEVAESRVRLLSGQIRPHFIFNSLSAIKALVTEDPELAERTIQDFSDYLRSHLDVMSSSRLVPFEQELDHVRHYVALEMADPVCPLTVKYDLQAEGFLVPPLTVQPLVENAIRHGILTREEGGTVCVATRENDNAVLVSVRDDGRGISSATPRQNEQSQVGLENVRERIERQCGGTLEVSSGPAGTTVTMTLPKKG